MGNLVSRPGLTRHAYQPATPGRVMAEGLTALVPGAMGGTVSYPVSQPLAAWSADGAPFYNSGYVTGYPSTPLPGGITGQLRLPPEAAQIDLSDRASWDRPVIWPNSR
jgi:hypothetical protein